MSKAVKFTGTESYITTRDLEIAVNAAMTLERPLLVKGEPGTGKTVLAREVATALGMPLIEWHVKSTTKAAQGLYEYDAVARLRDGQLGEAKVHDIANYIVRGKLWEAFTADSQVVLLIEDRAPVFKPADAPPPDLTGDWEQRREGGLGWHLIRQMMDEVRHEQVAGGGNRLQMVKRLRAH